VSACHSRPGASPPLSLPVFRYGSMRTSRGPTRP